MKNLFKTASLALLLLLALVSCEASITPNRVIKIEGDNNLSDVINLPKEIKVGDTVSVWYSTNRDGYVFQRLHTRVCKKAVVVR